MSDPTLPTIATWFVADDARHATAAPQVGRDSSSQRFHDVYWRCVCVFYLFSKLRNPGASHLFFSNVEPPAIGRLSVADYLRRLGVATVRLPITYRLPSGLVSAWGNQFYILDIIRWATQHLSGSLVVLDSDCVWSGGCQDLAAALERHGALTYRIDYPATHDINGTTRIEMKALLAAFGHPVDEVPYYAGGEIFAAAVDFCRRAWPTIERVWEQNIAAARSGPFLREEALFLSTVFAIHGVEGGTANRFIKRLWTGRKGSNVEPADVGLPIWHLPSEKKTGLRWLFERYVEGGRSLPRDEDGGREALAKHLGIPRRGLVKRAGDLLYLVRHRLET